jgi:enoyl-[acyl-carrier protein] reductase I
VSFIDLTGKTFLVFGVGSRRSVAYAVAQTLEREGATVLYGVHTAERREQLATLLTGREVHVCDLADESAPAALVRDIAPHHPVVHGVLHSVAFARYESFAGVFHEVSRRDFLECVGVTCHSLVSIASALKKLLDPDGSVVTISISTTRMAAEGYGYMAPAKAALDSTVVFLAKSFSRFSRVRFNAVGAGLLKTNASAGIPGYLDNYLFAEQATLRKEALSTREVADAAVFLLSPRSSGINAQCLVVDAGMGCNYFDETIVRHATRGIWPAEPDPPPQRA